MGCNVTKGLTKIEKELAHHESIIEDGVKSFLHVGRSLIAIRDGSLYGEKYGTFEAYCEKRWGFKRAQAYRLMEAAEVVKEVSEMSPIGDTKTDKSSTHPEKVIPQNEAQARALAGAGDTPEQRREVWTKAVETAPRNEAGEPVITARHIAKVADEVVGPKVAEPKPNPKLEPVQESAAGESEQPEYGASFDPRKFDERMADDAPEEVETTGEIPAHLIDVLADRKEYASLQRDIALLISRARALQAKPIGQYIRMQDVELHVGQVKADFRTWAFGDNCPSCQNKPTAKCLKCKGRGWIAQGQLGSLSDWDKEWLRQNSVNRSK